MRTVAERLVTLDQFLALPDREGKQEFDRGRVIWRARRWWPSRSRRRPIRPRNWTAKSINTFAAEATLFG